MENTSPHPAFIPVIVHLTGRLRGTTRRLDISGDEPLVLGTAPEAEIHFPADHADEVAPRHARLVREGTQWQIEVEADQRVWVNGREVQRAPLTSDDLLEIGSGGPVLRFRLHAPNSPTYKSMAEAFNDCIDCARLDGESPAEKTRIFLEEIPRELVREVSPWWRIGVLVVLVLLAANSLLLLQRSRSLEDRLQQEAVRVEGIEDLFDVARREFLKPDDLQQLQQELRSEVQSTTHRLEGLEDQLAADRRVISDAVRSVVFLQGAYGFYDPASDLPLRFLVDAEGRPQADITGSPAVGTDGQGPPVEAFFTGTGFVVDDTGQVITNRHVAIPWEFEEAAQAVAALGLEPRMRRFEGYLPGVSDPFSFQLVAASEIADVALLHSDSLTSQAPALSLASDTPQVGDAVIVLGYPTGIRALLARTDAPFVARLEAEGDLDFWNVAHRLAQAGHIAPLATRGIVGQVTEAAVVYDAETTSGGSGGPVLDLSGRVVAVNTAILKEFDGSNLGTPAARAIDLLSAAPIETKTDPAVESSH